MLILLILLIAPALADIANVDPCGGTPREVCQFDGSICPADQPECGQMLAADGWHRYCSSGNDQIWCAPAPQSAGWCSTIGFLPAGLGVALLAAALVRRPPTE